MHSQKGSALIVVMVMVVVLMGLGSAMTSFSTATSKHIYYSNQLISREYAAEAGLERLKVCIATSDVSGNSILDVGNDGTAAAVSTDSGSAWLLEQSTHTNGQVIWPSGFTTFAIDEYSVSATVVNLGDGWFLATSTADDGNETRRIAVTVRGESYWSDYARFVAKGNLNIGNNATYGGRVHCNNNINVVGSGVVFKGDVTAVGSLKAKSDTTFMKTQTANVQHIELPDEEVIGNKFQKAPEGALIYNADNFKFKNDFSIKTGYTPKPTDTVKTDITFNKDRMTVTTQITSGKDTYTMTESNIDVPYEKAIYCSDDVTVRGDISSRASVITPKDISIDGALRYVDDDGGSMWVYKDKTTGEVLDTTVIPGNESNSWSTMGNWTGSNYEYVQADDWHERTVNSDRTKPPVLGLMAGNTIWLTGDDFTAKNGDSINLENREIHAALFCSGDVIRPKVNGKKGNLYIHGSIITSGTNPVSSFFSYRTYAYDPNLKKYPPPEFNQNDRAEFTNWHIAD